MWVAAPTLADLNHVFANMRAMDAREAFALRSAPDPYAVAAEKWSVMKYMAVALAAGLDNSPRAVALLMLWPMDETGGLLSGNMVATPAWPKIARLFLAHLRGEIAPRLLSSGVRRIECRVLDAHRSSIALCRALGAVEEGRCVDYGPNGESFRLMAWRRSDWA